MRKLFLLLLVLCSVCFITACGGSEDDETTSEEGKACTQNMDCPIGYHCDTAKGECTNDSGNNGGGNGGGDIGDSGGNGGGGDNGDSGNGGNGDGGNGGSTTCEANKFLKCDPDDETSNKIIRCNRYGTGEESVPCGEDSVCDNDRCVQQECKPGNSICLQNDLSKVFKCSEKGLFSDEVAKDCGSGKCVNGDCTSLCEQAALDHSYQGCDFYTTVSTMTVESSFSSNRTDPIFALTISNTSETNAVNVAITVSSADGEVDAGKNYFCIDSEDNCQSLASTQSLSVEPGKLGIVMFPDDRHIKGQAVKWNSLHIKTDIPVTVYQFAPIDNSAKNPFTSTGYSASGSSAKYYSNDASLLIPTPSLYTDYVVSAHSIRTTTFYTYATVIGVSDEDTVITVKPTAAVTASNGIPAIAANAEGTITLKKGQVAQIEVNADLSGTRIFCDSKVSTCHPFVVFSGSNCTFIPTTYGYCDHIEQQLFPVQTWGRKYILVKSQARGEEWDYVRIYASKDGTSLTFKPATPAKISVPSGWTSFTVNDVKTELNAGEYSEFYFKGTLEVEANNQIMVAQYLTGADMISKSCQSSHGASCVGDPAMMLIPPAEQFRKDYLFLTPGSYVSNFATIVMKTGETPVLNGSAVSGIQEIAGTNFSYAIVNLGSAFKNHTLTCENNPCGLFVYGWEQDVSYAYPGGLNFEKLSTN